MAGKLVKEAIAPSDIIRAYQTVRLAKDYSRARMRDASRRLGGFLSNIEQGASRWGQSMDKLDEGLAALKGVGDEFKGLGSKGQEFLDHLDPKGLSRDAKRAMRSMRNLAVVGGGALAAALALRHYRDELKKNTGGGPKLQLTKEASRKAVLKTVLKGVGNAASAIAPYLATAAIPAAIGAASTLGGHLAGKAIDRYERKADKLWAKFVERFPEYEGNALAREHFDVMVDFNPTSARHPVVVKPFLDATTHPGGDQLLGINFVQNLTRIESDRARVDAERSKRIAETIRGPLLESARALTNMSDNILAGERTMAANQARAEEQLKQRVKSPLEREILLTRAAKDYADYLRAVGVDNPRKEDIDKEIERLRNLEKVPIDDTAFKALVQAKAMEFLDSQRNR